MSINLIIFIMKTQCCSSILLLVLITFLHCIQLCEGKPEGTMKTIKTEDDDVIDCVAIYKQPSLNHPLLKNHIIQMSPSSYIRRLVQANDDSTMTYQNWSRDEQCREGTIPIRRSTANESSPILGSRVLHETNNDFQDASLSTLHATKDIYGTRASLNVWNPPTENNDFSLSRILLHYVSGVYIMESAIAGWMVNPIQFGDKRTRLFVMYKSIGVEPCYNMDCPGFLQVNRKIALGAKIWPISTYKGAQYKITLGLILDRNTQNIWFIYGNTWVGYWPHSVIPYLSVASNYASWGGELYRNVPTTTTKMGSGHFPEEGWGKASFVANITYVSANGYNIEPDPNAVLYSISQSKCYGASSLQNTEHLGSSFFFGGPGCSSS